MLLIRVVPITMMHNEELGQREYPVYLSNTFTTCYYQASHPVVLSIEGKKWSKNGSSLEDSMDWQKKTVILMSDIHIIVICYALYLYFTVRSILSCNEHFL